MTTLAHEIVQSYQELGLAPGASLEEVKDAYRRLAKRLHPDRHPQASQGLLGQLMARVNQAYHTLKKHLAAAGERSRQRRARARRQARPAPPAPRPAPVARRESRDAVAARQGLEAGQRPALPPFECRLPARPGPQPLPGGWRLVGIGQRQGRLVYLTEVEPGVARISLPLRRSVSCPHCGGSGRRRHRPCPTCGGRGRITRSRHLALELPPGWRHGQVVELGSPGGRGSLLVELRRPAQAGVGS